MAICYSLALTNESVAPQQVYIRSRSTGYLSTWSGQQLTSYASSSARARRAGLELLCLLWLMTLSQMSSSVKLSPPEATVPCSNSSPPDLILERMNSADNLAPYFLLIYIFFRLFICPFHTVLRWCLVTRSWGVQRLQRELLACMYGAWSMEYSGVGFPHALWPLCGLLYTPIEFSNQPPYPLSTGAMHALPAREQWYPAIVPFCFQGR
jgi:hypothetical protein